MLHYIMLLTLHYSSHMHTYILYSISSTASLCNTCITSHFNYATLFTNSSHMYILYDTIYCILPMLLCTITHSYILMYIFFIPLYCVQDSSFGIVSQITCWLLLHCWNQKHKHFATLALTSANHVYVTNKIGFDLICCSYSYLYI